MKGMIIGEDYMILKRSVRYWIHVKSTIAHFYKLLQNTGRIYATNTLIKNTGTLVHTVLSTLDYCNNLFEDIHKRKIFRSQKEQNGVAAVR